ncbi:MAG TPA: tetratricopeptide repeat protein [Gemmatimonadales bacterium]|nr:tetratricopeptide repeat protein [Gemmatimonadales bacterium]
MALSEIEKLERRYADNPQGLTFAPLAEVHRKNGDVARALELLRPGLTIHPDYIPASIVLGRCHLDLGELPASEAAFAHVLALDGENVIALKALADITERLSRFDEAERWLRTLLEIDRSNDDARDQLGRVEAARRQTEGSAVVLGGEEAVAGGATASALVGGEVETTSPADAVSAADDDAGGTRADPDQPEATLTPAPALTGEPMLGWVAAPESAGVPDVTPLDLEELGTAGDFEGPRPEGIELDHAVELNDPVQPLSGLVGRDEGTGEAGSHDGAGEFRVEMAEDIVLNSSGGSEFQMANAAEELLGVRESREMEPSPPELPGVTPTLDASPVDDSSVGNSPAEASDAQPWQPSASESDASSAEAMAPYTADSATTSREDDEAPSSEPARENSLDTAHPMLTESSSAEPDASAKASTETAGEAGTALAADGNGIPGMEPDAMAASAAPWSVPIAESPRQLEPEPVMTASMAELLLQQGYPAEALTVYRHLVSRGGGEPRFQEKIAELEQLVAKPGTAEPEPAAAEPTSAPAPVYSVLVTHGQSVQGLLRNVLAARPPAIASGPAVHGTTRSGGEEAGGAPTRPAHDSLSLSSVFGEESTPTQPAVPSGAGGGPGQSGVSFDEFFGGSGAPSAPRPVRAPDAKGDDLDQFHAWLQNLKR